VIPAHASPDSVLAFELLALCAWLLFVFLVILVAENAWIRWLEHLELQGKTSTEDTETDE